MEEQEENFTEEQPTLHRPHHHSKPKEQHDLIFKIRQVLNLLFMILGVIAALMYSGYLGSGKTEQMGAVLAIIAISMKMAECVLRCKK